MITSMLRYMCCLNMQYHLKSKLQNQNQKQNIRVSIQSLGRDTRSFFQHEEHGDSDQHVWFCFGFLSNVPGNDILLWNIGLLVIRNRFIVMHFTSCNQIIMVLQKIYRVQVRNNFGYLFYNVSHIQDQRILHKVEINGLVQERRHSIAHALELLIFSYTIPSNVYLAQHAQHWWPSTCLKFQNTTKYQQCDQLFPFLLAY